MGILIKSAESLENLHNVDTIVLDKTGTITSGHPSVTDILVLDPSVTPNSFLKEAASVELGSEHPLAMAIVERAQQDVGRRRSQSRSVRSASRARRESQGKGTRLLGRKFGTNGRTSYPGWSGRERAKKAAERFAMEGKTPLFFARDGKLIGIIAVADTIRNSSRAAIRRFSEMGLHVVMLTGDNHVTAEAIRKQLGIEEAVSDVLPTEKEANIRALQAKGHKVAMVGDGINMGLPDVRNVHAAGCQYDGTHDALYQ